MRGESTPHSAASMPRPLLMLLMLLLHAIAAVLLVVTPAAAGSTASSSSRHGGRILPTRTNQPAGEEHKRNKGCTVGKTSVNSWGRRHDLCEVDVGVAELCE
ncbi:hypothetical protein HK405_014006, partial [Cladochytrium tenue]